MLLTYPSLLNWETRQRQEEKRETKRETRKKKETVAPPVAQIPQKLRQIWRTDCAIFGADLRHSWRSNFA
jgi:hypothetical protein